MAVVQLRHPSTDGRRYYDRRVAEGKTPMEAMRALKRRLSDVVYRQLVNDQKQQKAGEDTAGPRSAKDGPGRTPGGDYEIQRGRLEPQRRRFGQVTFRARQHRRYPDPRRRAQTALRRDPPAFDNRGVPCG